MSDEKKKKPLVVVQSSRNSEGLSVRTEDSSRKTFASFVSPRRPAADTQRVGGVEEWRERLHSDLIEERFGEEIKKLPFGEDDRNFCLGQVVRIKTTVEDTDDGDETAKTGIEIALLDPSTRKMKSAVNQNMYTSRSGDRSDLDNKIVLLSYDRLKEGSRNDPDYFVYIRNYLVIGENEVEEKLKDFWGTVDEIESKKRQLDEIEGQINSKEEDAKSRAAKIESKLGKLEKKNDELKEKNEKLEEKQKELKKEFDKLILLQKLGVVDEDANVIPRNIEEKMSESENFSGVDKWISGIRELENDAEFKKRITHYEKGGKRIIERFLSAMMTNQIIILAGPSGTGKTYLPQLLAKVFDNVKTEIISVQPNWTDEQDLFGYFNIVSNEYVGTEFLHVLQRANRHPEKLFFVVLDEMNLAHVEYYFAKYLSAMELENREIDLFGREKIKACIDELYRISGLDPKECDEPDEAIKRVPDDIKSRPDYQAWKEKFDLMFGTFAVKIPDNLQIIGTMNVDETTKSISPKVIDRSYIIEINNDSEAESDIAGYETVDPEEIIDAIETFITAFNDSGESVRLNKMSIRTKKHISDICERLKTKKASKDGELHDRNKLIDDLILSKILPTIRTSGMMIEEIDHENLIKKMQQSMNNYPNSMDKLQKMYNRNGMTYNYWES